MKKNKLFVIRKYIVASSAKEAISKDKNHPVEDVWVDEEWKKNNPVLTKQDMGFKHEANS